MEGARQFQDRILRDTSRRVGWAYAGRVRRSGDHSQVLLDASGFRLRGATCHYGRGSRPRRTRGNCLARWTETQVTVAIAFGDGRVAQPFGFRPHGSERAVFPHSAPPEGYPTRAKETSRG